MDISNLDELLYTVETKDDFIDSDEDTDITEAFDELNLEDVYEEELYSDSFDTMMDVMISRGKDVTAEKYTLETAILLEKGLDNYISESTESAQAENVLDVEANILRLRRMVALSDKLSSEYEIEDTFEFVTEEDDPEEVKEFDYKGASIEDLLYISFLYPEDFNEDVEATEGVSDVGKWVKGKFIKPPEPKLSRTQKVVGFLKRTAGKITDNASDAWKSDFGKPEKTPFFQRIKDKVSTIWQSIKKAGGDASRWVSETKVMTWFRSQLSKLKDIYSNRLQALGKAAAIGTAVIAFMTAILLLVRKVRRYRVNVDKQTKVLAGLSGEFNGEKTAKIISKDEINKMISACKSILSSAKKAAGAEVESVDDARSKFKESDMSTLGIRISNRGKAKFGKMSRVKKSLADHGYGSGDLAKMKSAHKEIASAMFDTAQAIASSSPGGGRGTRAIIQTADKAYRVTMTNIFAAAKALG